MLLKGKKTKWLAVPLAAFFLFFSTGAAAAPECHVESTAQPISKSEVAHNHAAHPHSHSPQLTTSAVLKSQDTPISTGSTLNNEICFIVGFIVLLLLRFLRFSKPTFSVSQIYRPEFVLPAFLSKNLGHLNLNHIQLGIIRI